MLFLMILLGEERRIDLGKEKEKLIYIFRVIRTILIVSLLIEIL